MYYISICICTFVIGWLTHLVIVSMSIHWASDPYVIFPHPFPFKGAFGLLIPILVISLSLFMCVMLQSRSKLYLFLWITFTAISVSVPMGLTSSSSLQLWVNRWDDRWTNTSHAMAFQLEKLCCGWNNYTDRAIWDCPFLSRSGCKEQVQRWIYVRYHQIFLTFFFISVLYVYSISAVIWEVVTTGVDCMWSEIEIPFAASVMYRRVD